MPRTKRPTRNVEKTGEDDDALKKLNKQGAEVLNVFYKTLLYL